MTGVISVSEALDYETTPNYQFSVSNSNVTNAVIDSGISD